MHVLGVQGLPRVHRASADCPDAVPQVSVVYPAREQETLPPSADAQFFHRFDVSAIRVFAPDFLVWPRLQLAFLQSEPFDALPELCLVATPHTACGVWSALASRPPTHRCVHCAADQVAGLLIARFVFLAVDA